MQNQRFPDVWDAEDFIGSEGTITTLPEVQTQISSSVQLAVGASLTFDFATSVTQFLDAWVLSDQPINVDVLVAESASAAFVELQGPSLVPAGPPAGQGNVKGLRSPATRTRVKLTNAGAAPTTIMRAEVKARSS
jgi:hypothetical protein